MRLLIVGGLQGQIGAATKIAMDRGAKVTHAIDIEQALASNCARRRGADLVFCDVTLDIGAWCAALPPNASAPRWWPAASAPTPPRGGRDPRRRQGISAPARRRRTDRRGAGRGGRREPSAGHEDEAMGAVSVAGRPGRRQRSLDPDHRRKRHRQGSAGPLCPPQIRRADKPFISVNCAAIPENLLESELFGHEKGRLHRRHRPAHRQVRGSQWRHAAAGRNQRNGRRLQAKLLRAIQEREIDRVGGTKPVKVDIRIIATSNRDLAEAVKHGTFREDLLYPPERRQSAPAGAARAAGKDIRALARHFARKYAEANGVPYRPARRDRALLLAIPGAAMCASWKTPCTAPCCWRTGRRSCPEAIRLPDGSRSGHPRVIPGTARCRAPWCRRRRDARPGRPHRRRCRARPDPGHAGPLPGQPHPCRQHPGHLDPHPAQQAEANIPTRASRSRSHGEQRRAG
jgi:two-component system response regulator FlrC